MELKIPDAIRPQLEQLSKRLWDNKAVVMVGAGFSKNASRTFPDWWELGDKLYKLAHGKQPNENNRAYMSLLKVAQEAEASAGRPALDALLRSEIPDKDVTPSDLHTDLLQLPWSDVFTTNYDTLLERASDKVLKHRYSYVTDQSGLPYSEKPRIIKLHGCFNSNNKLVITEEDYRRYPSDNAPFVNTVQQSILENSLVLIGFSGDDPNFLSWIGWIRDHLGYENVQPIYLVTASKFSSAQSRLLEKRNIQIVDMSLCTDVGINGHYKGLEKFLDMLALANPSRLDWPETENPDSSIYKPASAELEFKDIQNTAREWQKQRERYPGWLILPVKNRGTLYYSTESWISINEKDIEEISSAEDGTDICFIFELIWRLEKCLLPVFDDIAELASTTLRKYWPFQFPKTTANHNILFSDQTKEQLNWENIKQAWLYIQFALLRYYREEGKQADWEDAKTTLDSLTQYFTSDQEELFQYEIYLNYLYQLDIKKAEEQLSLWTPKPSAPYWLYKRLTAMMEFGQIEEPVPAIEDLLTRTRKQNNPDHTSLYLASSQEAYQMQMLKWAQQTQSFPHAATETEIRKVRETHASFFQNDSQKTSTSQPSNLLSKQFNNVDDDWYHLQSNKDSERKKDWQALLSLVRETEKKRREALHNARLDELKSYRIDPSDELTHLQLQVQRDDNVSLNQSFDIDQKYRPKQLHYPDRVTERHSFSLLRFYEDAGIPLRFGYSKIAGNSALIAISRLAKYTPNWARITLLRIANHNELGSLFDRSSLQQMAFKEVNDLAEQLLIALKSCEEGFNDIKFEVRYSIEYKLAQSLPEVLSRLTSKCSLQTKEKIWTLINKLYSSGHKNKFYNIANLTRRMLESLSIQQKLNWVQKLIDVPFPEQLSPIAKREYLNPFVWFTPDLNTLKRQNYPLPQLDIPQWLFDFASSEDLIKRKWALNTLISVHKLHLLSPQQIKTLTDALWTKLDDNGLPKGFEDYYRFTLHKLPSPGDVDLANRIKECIKKQSFPVQKEVDGAGRSLTRGNIELVHEIIGGGNQSNNLWQHDDAVFWLDKIISWWDSDKEQLKTERERPQNSFFGVSDEFHRRLQNINELLAKAVIPNISLPAKHESLIINKLARLLEEMKAEGLQTLQAESQFLRLSPARETELIEYIADNMLSKNIAKNKDALIASMNLIKNDDNKDTQNAATQLLLEFINWNQTISIATSMEVCCIILGQNPRLFEEKIEKTAVRRLNSLVIETTHSSDNSEYKLEDGLVVREAAMKLASELNRYHKTKQGVVPDDTKTCLNTWKHIADNENEFAEIRNAWSDGY